MSVITYISYWWFPYQQQYHHPMSTHYWDDFDPCDTDTYCRNRSSTDLLKRAMRLHNIIQQDLERMEREHVGLMQIHDRGHIELIKKRETNAATIENLSIAVNKEHGEFMKTTSPMMHVPCPSALAPTSAATVAAEPPSQPRTNSPPRNLLRL